MAQNIQQLMAELHPLEKKVLGVLKDQSSLWDHELVEQSGLDDSRCSMALGWLLSKDVVKQEREVATAFISITELGRKYASEGIPEQRILKRLKAGEKFGVRDLAGLEGMESSEISKAIGNLKAYDIIRIVQGGLLSRSAKEIPAYADSVLKNLLVRLSGQTEPQKRDILSSEENELIEDILEKKWKTRGVIKQSEKKSKRMILTNLGQELVKQLTPETVATEEISQLTPDMLRDGSWKGQQFRKYNIGLSPARKAVGRKHPYREFLDSVKSKLVAMGFEEMRGPLVESEFWNSDALFMPQFHPARDIHDVYFVADPKSVRSLPVPYATQVAKTHENGWKTGSRGWQYAFEMDRSKRLVLRSQGTSVSARTLAASPKIPGKYFSIARCFRYDLVDATHAPDFFQVEGIALGEKINFRTLLGLLKLFASEMARATEVKYLPAYFPYTEPSVEMHVRHPKLGWMELGGAGLFRPEVTRALGVEVPVIAWGLGLDRMAMIALDIQDIRELFSADLDFIRTKRTKQAKG